MAYIHTSVNQKSKEYLANERRYNYTTPKSFLEQIKLYRSLLDQKGNDLTTKMGRLENGLQKLNSTSTQVVSLNTISKLHFYLSWVSCRMFLFIFITDTFFFRIGANHFKNRKMLDNNPNLF